jgi:hypothetical protein
MFFVVKNVAPKLRNIFQKIAKKTIALNDRKFDQSVYPDLNAKERKRT